MYFSNFPNYAPPKPSEMDNYLKIIDIFGNQISKCTYLMNKRTPVSAYIGCFRLYDRSIDLISSRGSPCSYLCCYQQIAAFAQKNVNSNTGCLKK